jgi:hypothetical protein
LDISTATTKQLELLQSILEFAMRSSDLEVEQSALDQVRIKQKVDGHMLVIRASRLQDILMRNDSDGRSFVQVNFQDGLKILITERLIGFKPAVRKAIAPAAGQGAPTNSAKANSKLPRVVTTPDLLSVLGAMEDAAESADRDLTLLRELFDSIVRGAERAGFDVEKEKAWLLPYMNACPGLRANA